jgi:hypothetical protein
MGFPISGFSNETLIAPFGQCRSPALKPPKQALAATMGQVSLPGFSLWPSSLDTDLASLSEKIMLSVSKVTEQRRGGC